MGFFLGGGVTFDLIIAINLYNCHINLPPLPVNEHMQSAFRQLLPWQGSKSLKLWKYTPSIAKKDLHCYCPTWCCCPRLFNKITLLDFILWKHLLLLLPIKKIKKKYCNKWCENVTRPIKDTRHAAVSHTHAYTCSFTWHCELDLWFCSEWASHSCYPPPPPPPPPPHTHTHTHCLSPPINQFSTV